ncbi:UDP-N-acetylglucosamine 1-carboxyvinyltransferase, partial [Pasteurella multocida]|nr:UDP-N-acetylglucosamine 1-carboxyvinyltransferase [Pasteurella multocida]
ERDREEKIKVRKRVECGRSIRRERKGENGWMEKEEVSRMGGKEESEGNKEIGQGDDHKRGAEERATEKRASKRIVLEGCIEKGETIVDSS